MGSEKTYRVDGGKRVLVAASVASMIDQFNMPNIQLLLNLGYEVHVACNFKEGNTCDRKHVRWFQEKLSEMHVTWHQWDCPRDIRQIRACCAAYRQMLELTGACHYEWMHCHSPVGGALARLAAHRQGIRVIYTAHGFHFYQGAPVRNWLLYYPAEKLLAHWTDVLLTVNQEDYCLAKRKLKAGKVGYIPGVGMDASQYQKQIDAGSAAFRKKHQIPENAPILLSVGELSRRKNHQMVISALPGLAEKGAHYLICGQGEQKGALLRKARKSGILERVHILGFQEDVAELYHNADVFVFPSKQEGLPVALLEAMASGLACAVSDIRGNRELIDERCKGHEGCGNCERCEGKERCEDCGGVRFPLNQPERLRAALDRLLADPRFRQECGQHNKEKAQKYDWQAVVGQRTKRIYRWIGRER